MTGTRNDNNYCNRDIPARAIYYVFIGSDFRLSELTNVN